MKIERFVLIGEIFFNELIAQFGDGIFKRASLSIKFLLRPQKLP